MTVNFIGTALINQHIQDSVGSKLTKMGEITKQVDTQRKYEKLYKFSPPEANEVVNISLSIFNQQSNLEVLQKGLRRTNEMSNELDGLRKYLKKQLKSWQEQANPTNNFTDQQKKEFASNLLSELENFLNKTSIYDGTFLFSGESVDTRPISTSNRNVNQDNYYNGSTQNVVFNYNSKQTKLDFNAGDKSVKSLVELFSRVKNLGGNAGGDVLT